jgi:signal transduction histidine kinase
MDAPTAIPSGLWIAINGLTIAFYAGFAVFVYLRRPAAPLWPVLFWTQLAAFLWATGDLLAFLSPDLAAKSAALVVLYTGSLPLAGLWFLMAVRFAEANGVPFRWGRRPWVLAPLGLAALAWMAFVTNPWHGQFVTIRLGAAQEHHWMWWTASLASQGLGLATAGLYISIARQPRLPTKLREQADILLAATLVVPLANLLNSLMPQIWPVDLTVATGSLVGALYLYGIYRTNLFDLAPIALEQVVREDPTGVLVTDSSLRLCFANEAAQRLLPGIELLPGAAVPELLSDSLTPYRDPTTPARWSPEWNAELGSTRGRLYHFDSEAVGTAGQTSWLWISASSLAAGTNGPRYRCLRIQDVTELAEMARQRQELSARLERSERLESLGVLAGGVAHELSAPLASVRNDAQRALTIFERGGPEDADVESRSELRRTLLRVARESRRGSDIASHMLRFAQESGPSAHIADLNAVVQRACTRADATLKRRGCDILFELAEVQWAVRGGPGDIEQLMANLLDNAAHAAGRGGQVRVQTEFGERDARIRVIDDGPGMEEEVRQRALEPFFTTRRRDGGSGLGLSVVHGIAATYGGQVEIHSKPGLGCEVEVRLPLAPIGTAPAVRPAGEALQR